MEIDGIRMLIGLVIGITLLIMLVLKTKVQTFLALIISAIMIGIIGGMPLTATDVVDAAGDARTGVSKVGMRGWVPFELETLYSLTNLGPRLRMIGRMSEV